MNAVIKRDDQSLALPEIMSLGDVFTKSGYFRDVREQAQAVVKILYGRELGFSPVVSMMGIHVIEGKPALSANLMGAMVKRSGRYDYRVTKLTDTECTLDFTQDGQAVGQSTFTMQDAQKARVIRDGSGWTKYPRNMLFARALSNGVKLFCPELSACPIYVPEELGAEVNEEGAVISAPSNLPEPKRTSEVRTFGKPPVSGSVDDTQNLVKEPSSNNADPGTVADPELVDDLKASIDYISVGQQKNFHKQFREEFIKHHPDLSTKADDYCYQWLTEKGFRDKNKLPSAAVIPQAGWFKIRDAALEYAKTLNSPRCTHNSNCPVHFGECK